MEVADFGGTVNGKKISVLASDYQNKVDITVATALRWMDTEGVDMIMESTDSASALALFKLGEQNKRVIMAVGSATTALTNNAFMPHAIHYASDTSAPATGTGGPLDRQSTV